MMKKKIKHVDGITNVVATGEIVNGEFVGEYRLHGMSYGVTIPLNNSNQIGDLHIMEGNRRISDFLALVNPNHTVHIKVTKFNGDTVTQFKKPEKMCGKDWEKSTLRFHSSWDSLMSVVDIIETLGGEVNIEADTVRLHFPGHCIGSQRFDKEMYNSKIIATWRAVVEFAGWYSTQ